MRSPTYQNGANQGYDHDWRCLKIVVSYLQVPEELSRQRPQ